MQEISQLVESTPLIFHKVSMSLQEHDASCIIQCKVEPGYDDEDQVLDIYQAIIDICLRQVAYDTFTKATIDLEYPDESSFDMQYGLATRIVLYKRLQHVVRLTKTFFNAQTHDYSTFKKDINLFNNDL